MDKNKIVMYAKVGGQVVQIGMAGYAELKKFLREQGNDDAALKNLDSVLTERIEHEKKVGGG